MASILDGLGLEGSVLDGLAEWPASTSRRDWFAITRQLIRQTIADMDLDPAAPAEVAIWKRIVLTTGGSFQRYLFQSARKSSTCAPLLTVSL